MNSSDIEKIAILKSLRAGIRDKIATIKDVIILRITVKSDPAIVQENLKDPFRQIVDMIDEQHIADHIRDMGKLEALEDLVDVYSETIKYIEDDDKQKR